MTATSGRWWRWIRRPGPCRARAGDACGIVVAARAAGTAWVLEDRSVRGLSPAGWAARVARAAADWSAALGCPVRVVAEGNQGGEMVEAVLKGAGLACPVRRVHARVGKRARAEPVAALYEQGRVGHVAGLTALEEELLGLGARTGGAQPGPGGCPGLGGHGPADRRRRPGPAEGERAVGVCDSLSMFATVDCSRARGG